jgi:hypothetical protein
LKRLDPNNRAWKQAQLAKAQEDKTVAEGFQDATLREKALAAADERIAYIERSFDVARDEFDFTRKLFLIENCIYGVDIQQIAVQIAKLRFFISLMAEQTVNDEKPNRNILSLPNLETKFVAGNTLIGLSRRDGLIFHPDVLKVESALRTVRRQIFYTRRYRDKKNLRKEEAKQRELLKEALLKSGFGEGDATLAASWNPFDQMHAAPFYDSEMMFGFSEYEGFDIVIGNPPYVSANNMSIHDRNFFNSYGFYKTLKGKWDLYLAFTERSLRLLEPNGFFTFIVPFGLLNQPFAEEMRKTILKDYTLHSIVDLHNNKIFENATIPSCIPLIQKAVSKSYRVEILEYQPDQNVFLYKHAIDIAKYRDGTQHMFRTEDLNAKSSILKKIKEAGSLLEQQFYVSTGAEIHGKETRATDGTTISGTSKFDVLHSKYQKGLKPYIEGSAIKKAKEGRYSIPVVSTWLDYSNTEAMRSPKFKELFDSEKIIVRGSSGLLRILAIYDDQKIYTSHKCTMIIRRSDLPKKHSQYQPLFSLELKFFLALINSQLMDFYYESVYGGFIDVYPNNLKELPIPQPSEKSQTLLITLVDRILAKKKSGEDTTEEEAEIDSLVYALYGLTEEEIAVVEGRA